MSQAPRPCLEVVVPPGPDGLRVLLPALAGALDGSGPAIAVVPGTGSARYREGLRAATRPGLPVAAEVAVVLSTSGSTGDPAGVLLPATGLAAAAEGFAARTAARHRWVSALPLHHAGGLMVAVRALLAGTVPVALAGPEQAAPFTVDSFAEATIAAREAGEHDGLPLAVSLVPAMLAAVDRAGSVGLDALLGYDVVLVGGAALPSALEQRLRSAGVRLRRSYGMTETCGGAVLDGLPLPGMRVTVTGGRLRLAGPQVAAGYRDGRQPQRWGAGPDALRWFQTDDLGSVSAAGVVTVVGRADDVVQVGGASVSVGAVAEVLRSDPRVMAAEVVAVPDERLGAALVALVVPQRGACSGPAMGGPVDPGRTRLAEGLIELAADALGRAGRPRHVRLLRAIPMLESGKPDRRALARLAAEVVR